MTDLALTKLQTLFRTLFQFDSADLNFGIYRVLNYKRAEIEAFIDVRLPQIADEAFARYAAADRSKLEDRLQELRQSLKGGVDEEGNLKPPFDQLELGKEYLDVQRQVAALSVAAELKTRVYNDLYTFFNRYYEDGDFVPKRRRGRDETYAVPYNGEEVLLHWANKDQYYIKTDERLAAYRFHTGEFHVAFEVRAAHITTNNNKSENRFYVLASDPVAWDSDAKMLTVAFQHRALTESEAITHGKTGQQDKINGQSAETVLAAASDTTLKGLLGRVPTGSDRSALLKHLGQFTRRNTLDFFIHKDLKGFLTRELDHFIKTEALRLDDLLADHADALPTQVQRARATRHVALSLIDLLAQVEDFQKRLFEKKKFVLRTDYCLTLDRVPEDFWPEVLANEAQKADWQALYGVNEIMAKDGVLNTGMGADFLRAHPSLMIDTRHFSEEFKWRLLSALDDLDSNTDGVLLDSENFQALNLLVTKYLGKIRCTYLDPPYNTAASEILYKNDYKHSSWLSMIDNRIEIGKRFIDDDGVLCITIDDFEVHGLWYVLTRHLSAETHIGTAPIRNNPQGRATVNGLRIKHEYALFFSRGGAGTKVGRLERTVEQTARYDEVDEDGQPYLWENFRKTGTDSERPDRPKQFYPIYVKGDVWRVPALEWVAQRRELQVLEEPAADEKVLWPIDEGGTERVWKWGFGRVADFPSHIKIVAGGGAAQAYNRNYLNQDGSLPGTWWDKPQYAAGSHGTNLLTAMFGTGRTFLFPKSLYAVMDCLRVGGAGPGSVVLDYFGGSGTTGHAVINLNREDKGGRKYILAEMGEYVASVLLPRLKKAVYCPDWKDGKPVGGDGVSQIIKYHALEQYEDTLNNLDVQQRAAASKQAAIHFKDEYLLRYMLDFETQGSPSLLDLDALADPFDYKLNIKQGDEIRPHPVDLVETFNYLLGLTVTRLRAFDDGGREYRAVLGEKGGRRVAVVWRKASDLAATEEALARDRTFIEGTLLPSLLGAGVTQDRLYVNSPCAVTGAEAVEPEFKRLMFGEAL